MCDIILGQWATNLTIAQEKGGQIIFDNFEGGGSNYFSNFWGGGGQK